MTNDKKQFECVTPGSESIRATVRNDVLEEAAKVCEYQYHSDNDEIVENVNVAMRNAAAAIRALKSSAGAVEKPVALPQGWAANRIRHEANEERGEMIAYCLTGPGGEHALFFPDADGTNGVAGRMLRDVYAAPASTKEPADTAPVQGTSE